MHKLGKGEPRIPDALHYVEDYHVEGLAPPPPSVHYATSRSNTNWGMDGNDRYGDCVMAATGHAILAANIELAEKDKVPSSTTIVKEYLKLTGGQDTGLVIADTLKVWHTEGLFGHKIAGYAPVKARDITQVEQVIDIYGGCLLGIQLPESAEEQFPADWSFVPGSPNEGGHAIYALGYDDLTIDLLTWGRRIRMSKALWTHDGDEAWAIVFNEDIEAGKGPSGLLLPKLEADLALA